MKNRHFILLFLLFVAGTSQANTCTWTGQQNTDWNNPANWDCQSVPGTADSVLINGGANMPSIQGTVTIKSLYFAQSGSINGAGILNVNAYMRANSLTISLTVKVVINGVLSLKDVVLNISAQRFQVAGSASIESGSIFMTNTGEFQVKSAATATIVNKLNIFGLVPDTTFFVNGTLNKTGTGVMDFEAVYAFSNAVVNIKGGAIANYYQDNQNSCSILNSVVNIDSAATLRIHRIINIKGSNITGKGTLRVVGATCNIQAGTLVGTPIEVAGGAFSAVPSGLTFKSLKIEGGSFNVPTASISENLIWKAGSLNGAIVVQGTSTILDTTAVVQDRLATGLTIAGGGSFAGNDNVKGNITVPVNAIFTLNPTQNVELNANLNLSGTLLKNGKDTVNLSGFLLHAATGIIQGRGTYRMSGGHVFQGHLAPGNGIDTLTIKQNTLAMQPGASLNFEINGAQHDKLYVKNNLNVTGGILNLTEYAPAPTGTYILVETSGTVTGNFSSANLPPGYIVTYNTNRVNVVKSTLAPIANFSVPVHLGCQPFTVQFVNTSANATSYQWSFPGGIPSSSTEVSPIVTYPSLGFFDVTLLAFNQAGSSSKTLVNFIEVREPASPSFSYSVSDPVVTFSNASTNAYAYVWDFGDGNVSTESDPVHTYLYDGNYLVKLGAINACDTFFTTQVLTVHAPPVPAFSAPVTSGCIPFTVQFANNSSNLGSPATFNWAFPGAAPSSSNEANPTVLYNSVGTYNVSLTATNAIGAATSTQNAFVTTQTIPSPAFGAFVTGYSVFFSNQTQNGLNYFWDLGDGTLTSEVSPTHIYATEGFYIVKLTAVNACGSKVEQQTVVIVGPPSVEFAAQQTSGCAPFTVQFSNLSQNASEWNWSFDGGEPSTSTLYNPTVVYSSPGIYGVTLTASNASGQNTLVKTSYIEVKSLPIPGFLIQLNNATVSMINSSSNAQAYSWDFGDGSPTSSEQNPSHQYNAPGTYIITLSASNDCGVLTTQNTVTILPSAVSEWNARPDIRIFPNPNSGHFSIEVPENLQVESIDLIDLSGKKLEAHQITQTGEYIFTIRMQPSYTRMCYLRLNTLSGVYHYKVLSN